jgi:hypothetical protein
VFDDPEVGLIKEPFVGGTDDLIDIATANIPSRDEGFIAIFSDLPFRGSQICLEWVREELSGNVYRWADQDREGWLCPALLKYFEKPPRNIHIQIRPG